jgi:predicted nucleotidyltransferase
MERRLSWCNNCLRTRKDGSTVNSWTPTDGDILLTEDRFVFYVFGYEHPKEWVFAFLKYIPSTFQSRFPLRFLKQSWGLGDVNLSRPEQLYTAQNYQKILETFREDFPQYVHFCSLRGKDVISVPLDRIEETYVPKDRLQRLFENTRRDALQTLAAELILLLSSESSIPVEDFGIHGSIAMDMHTDLSDIDFAVYGAQNFRRLEATMDKLVDEGTLRYIFTKKLDKRKKYKGRYKGKIFVYNATRKTEQITWKYGDYRYFPIKPVTFQCNVANDDEAMFRPAIYQIADYQPLNSASKLRADETPVRLVAMIGYYRNIARRGDAAQVCGTLERVEAVETGQVYYQVVVGTGTRGREHIWPL